MVWSSHSLIHAQQAIKWNFCGDLGLLPLHRWTYLENIIAVPPATLDLANRDLLTYTYFVSKILCEFVGKFRDIC